MTAQRKIMHPNPGTTLTNILAAIFLFFTPWQADAQGNGNNNCPNITNQIQAQRPLCSNSLAFLQGNMVAPPVGGTVSYLWQVNDDKNIILAPKAFLSPP